MSEKEPGDKGKLYPELTPEQDEVYRLKLRDDARITREIALGAQGNSVPAYADHIAAAADKPSMRALYAEMARELALQPTERPPLNPTEIAEVRILDTESQIAARRAEATRQQPEM